VTVGVRPDALKPDEKENGLPVRVDIVETLGASVTVYGVLEGFDAPLVALLPAAAHVQAGEMLNLGFDPHDAYLFDARGAAFARKRP
jgi:multiple sugar transport system ATP-binding protein